MCKADFDWRAKLTYAISTTDHERSHKIPLFNQHTPSSLIPGLRPKFFSSSTTNSLSHYAQNQHRN